MGQDPSISSATSSTPANSEQLLADPTSIRSPPRNSPWLAKLEKWAKELEPFDPVMEVAKAGLTMISILIAISGVCISWWLSSSAFNRAEATKKLDLEEHFLARFHEIYDKFDPFDNIDGLDEKQLNLKRKSFFNRLYGLHSEEFRHYKNGLIEPGTYFAWLRFRLRDYNSKDDKRREIEKAQWIRVRQEYLVDREFIDFMDGILSIKVRPEKAFSDDRDAENAIHALLKRVRVTQGTK
jgi:hypothetical protein